MKTIQDGDTVALNFKLTFDDGTAVDSNDGMEPVEFVQGEGILLPAIEAALLGKVAGDNIQMSIPPEEGYGFADPSQIQQVDIADIPDEARHAGGVMTAIDDAGEQQVVMVVGVNDDKAEIDFNHPYAGRTLCYDVDVVSVK